ncbi:MAG: hypothetical protein H9Q65_06350 [Spiroplasma ixodetis]|nr:hypothetical protein [Spiroplasma ixodetis]
MDEKISDFINHYKNVQAAEKKLGKGFYANPMRAKNKKTEGQGFYINSKKKKLKLPIKPLSDMEIESYMQKI